MAHPNPEQVLADAGISFEAQLGRNHGGQWMTLSIFAVSEATGNRLSMAKLWFMAGPVRKILRIWSSMSSSIVASESERWRP